MSRVAISIGVSNAKGFKALPAAAPSARRFADWARGHGFDVHEFNDADGPVESGDLIAGVKAVVKAAGIRQVFVFFAGHGVASGPDNDYWILSDGYIDAVDASASIGRARNLAKLRHVVFFADACRTSAASSYLTSIDGAPAFFPAARASDSIATVDVFNGTIAGKSALEVVERRDDGKVISAHGIFTEALEKALSGQEQSVLRLQPGTGATVIYASVLKPYLERVVRSESARRVEWTQNPDCRPASGESLPLVELAPPARGALPVRAVHPDGSPADGSRIEILDLSNPLDAKVVQAGDGPDFDGDVPNGMYGLRASKPEHLQTPDAPAPLALVTGDHDPMQVVLTPAMALAGGDAPSAQPALLNRYVVDETGERHPRPPTAGVYTVVNEDLLTGRLRSEWRLLDEGAEPVLTESLPVDEDAERSMEDMAMLPARPAYETATGVSITPAVEGIDPTVLGVAGHHHGFGLEDGYSFVRGAEPASVLVDLGESGWAGFGMFPGFMGEALLGEKGVESLRYRPAPGTLWAMNEVDGDETRRLLMIAESAVRLGHFELVGQDSVSIAGEMRWFKHQNPMLGVYAAYAYDEAGRTDGVRDMIEYFVDREQPVPFDIAMLSGLPIAEVRGRIAVAPDFPLLRRGWAHLRERDVTPPPLVEAARALTSAMFTTFRGPSAEALAEALNQQEPLW